VLKILRHLGSRSANVEDLARSLGIDSNAIDELISLGLLRLDGALISVTNTGEQAELHLRTSKRRASAGHE
jgi:hypothetical protein